MRILKNLSLSSICDHIRPLPVILFLYISGILFGSSINFDLFLLFFILSTLLILAIISYLKQWKITTILFFILFILIGIFNVNLHNKPPENHHITNYVSENKITVIGTVLDQKCYPDNNKLSLKIKANYVVNNGQKIQTRGLFLLNIYDVNEKYEYGDELTIKGILKRPMEPGNFGDFDYELYLAQKNIFSCMNVWLSHDVRTIGKEEINPLIIFSLRTRDKIKNIITNTFPEPYNYLLIGMMLGEKSFVPRALIDTFIDAGVMHILAVSGLHVGIIAGFLILLFGMLRIPKKAKYIFVLILLASYVSVSGFRPSVMRATIMFSILIIGKMIDRNRNVFNSLFFAALIILLINPLTLYDSGFLLSFFVTFFIIYLVPVIRSIFSSKIRWVDNALSLSFAAWLGVFPLSAYFFNKVSIISIIANIFVIPLAGIVVILGFFTFFIGLLSIQLAGMTAFIGYWLLRLMVLTVKGFSSLPFSFFYIGQPSIIMIVLYYLLLIIFVETYFKLKYFKKFRGKIAVVILVTLFSIILVNMIFLENDLKVHYINVGEGDCIFIQAPNHFNILIDGGGSPRSEFDVGENILIPYLRRIGVHDIDVLMLSHPHLDHLEGLLPVMKEFNVDMVMDNRISCDIPEYIEFLSIIDEKEIPYHHTVAGDYFKINRFTEMLILNPPSNKEKINDDSDLNNNSIVLKLSYKNTDFLFTGDVEKEAEIGMLAWGNILNSDVLKVGHHGSSTSTNLKFLNKVSPAIAVITTGKNNFGHPSDKVISRLEENGIKVFRTDLNGTVIIETDGDDYFVKTSRRY